MSKNLKSILYPVSFVLILHLIFFGVGLFFGVNVVSAFTAGVIVFPVANFAYLKFKKYSVNHIFLISALVTHLVLTCASLLIEGVSNECMLTLSIGGFAIILVDTINMLIQRLKPFFKKESIPKKKTFVSILIPTLFLLLANLVAYGFGYVAKNINQEAAFLLLLIAPLMVSVLYFELKKYCKDSVFLISSFVAYLISALVSPVLIYCLFRDISDITYIMTAAMLGCSLFIVLLLDAGEVCIDAIKRAIQKRRDNKTVEAQS